MASAPSLSDWKYVLRDIGWRTTAWTASRYGFFINWLIAITPLLLAILILFPQLVEMAFLVAIIAAEFLSGVLAMIARWRARSRAFLTYSILRVSKSRDRQVVVHRLEESLNAIRDLLEERIGSDRYAAYVLESIGSETTADDDDTADDDELPSTFRELSKAMVLEYADRMHDDVWPWRSLEPLLSRFQAGVESETQEASLREALAETFAKVRPWYRQWSISPPRSRLTRFAEVHKELLHLITAIIVLIVVGVAILVQLFI